jgi:transcription antitermination factor NusG
MNEFKYLDKVRITKGFYEGQTGIVVDTDSKQQEGFGVTLYGDMYTVQIQDGKKIQVGENFLIKACF